MWIMEQVTNQNDIGRFLFFMEGAFNRIFYCHKVSTINVIENQVILWEYLNNQN
jgi:hypothetical protein